MDRNDRAVRQARKVYRIIPERSARHYLLGLLVVAGFLSLFAVPIGWWIGGLAGAILGFALSVLVFVLADGFAVREIRLGSDGTVEFRSSWRGQRIAGSQIRRVTGYLDEDEGDRSYNFQIAGRRRPIGVDHFTELPIFIEELRALNPNLEVTGDWPSEGGSGRVRRGS
jgi:hypothetical protein